MQRTDGKVDIRGREYKTVALRVTEFREGHTLGDGWSIVTSIVSRDAESVCMRAEVQKEGVTLATGHAEERRVGKINEAAALENCETSAIGRALASAGFVGSEFASADEIAHKVGGKQEPKHQHAGYINQMVKKSDVLDTKAAVETEQKKVAGLDLSDQEREACVHWLRQRWTRINQQEKSNGDASGAAAERGGEDRGGGDGEALPEQREGDPAVAAAG